MKSLEDRIVEKTYELTALQELFEQEEQMLKSEEHKFAEDRSKYENAKAKLEKEIKDLQEIQNQKEDEDFSNSEVGGLLE